MSGARAGFGSLVEDSQEVQVVFAEAINTLEQAPVEKAGCLKLRNLASLGANLKELTPVQLAHLTSKFLVVFPGASCEAKLAILACVQAICEMRKAATSDTFIPATGKTNFFHEVLATYSGATRDDLRKAALRATLAVTANIRSKRVLTVLGEFIKSSRNRPTQLVFCRALEVVAEMWTKAELVALNNEVVELMSAGLNVTDPIPLEHLPQAFSYLSVKTPGVTRIALAKTRKLTTAYNLLNDYIHSEKNRELVGAFRVVEDDRARQRDAEHTTALEEQDHRRRLLDSVSEKDDQGHQRYGAAWDLTEGNSRVGILPLSTETEARLNVILNKLKVATRKGQVGARIVEEVGAASVEGEGGIHAIDEEEEDETFGGLMEIVHVIGN